MMFFNKKEEIDENEIKILADISALNIDLINAGIKSNLELTLDIIPTLYVLYGKHFKFDKENPKWINRDRFITYTPNTISALISTLFISGYNIDLEQLKENNLEISEIPGLDAIINKIEDVIPLATGTALGEQYLNKYFKNIANNLYNFYTYQLITDYNLIGGSSYEAFKTISKNKLNKLITFYYKSKETFSDKEKLNLDPIKYFEALNYNIINTSKDNFIEIDNAITQAKESDKPTVIILSDSNNDFKFENSYNTYNYKLTQKEMSKIKKKLNVRDIAFSISNESVEKFQEMINNHMNNQINNWNKIYDKLPEEHKNELETITNDELLTNNNIDYIPEENETIQTASIKILESIHDKNFLFYSNIEEKMPNDNIITIQNGLALMGIRSYSVNNLSDANKYISAIEYAAKNNLNNIYIFLENGNSNNLISLRNIDNVEVFRPNDINETIGAFKIMLNRMEGPSCIIINTNNTNAKEITSINDVKKGAYVIKREDKAINAILISNGSELDITLDVCKVLNEKGFDIRVVSMPSIELYNKQENDYKEELFPIGIKKFVIERSTSYSWYQFVYNDKYLITTDKVEWYNKAEEINEFTDKVIEKIENLIK